MNTTESQPKLIDLDQLNSACDSDPTLRGELMQMYFDQADKIMAGLHKAVENGMVKDVDHLAHKLVGSSLACGLVGIVPPLREMEHNAKAGHLHGAETLLVEAVKGLELLRQAVQDGTDKSNA